MGLKQSVAILFATLVILCGAASLGLYLQQTRLIFFPSSVIETTPGDLGLVYEEVWVPVVRQPAAPQPKRLWLVPNAGHNNVADIAGTEYFKVVEQFLEKCLSR